VKVFNVTTKRSSENWGKISAVRVGGGAFRLAPALLTACVHCNRYIYEVWHRGSDSAVGRNEGHGQRSVAWDIVYSQFGVTVSYFNRITNHISRQSICICIFIYAIQTIDRSYVVAADIAFSLGQNKSVYLPLFASPFLPLKHRPCSLNWFVAFWSLNSRYLVRTMFLSLIFAWNNWPTLEQVQWKQWRGITPISKWGDTCTLISPHVNDTAQISILRYMQKWSV